jgi:hypothetical protein
MKQEKIIESFKMWDCNVFLAMAQERSSTGYNDCFVVVVVFLLCYPLVI